VQALPLLGAATALPMRALMATMAIRGALTLLLLILGERMSTSGVRTSTFGSRALHSFYIL